MLFKDFNTNTPKRHCMLNVGSKKQVRGKKICYLSVKKDKKSFVRFLIFLILFKIKFMKGVEKRILPPVW